MSFDVNQFTRNTNRTPLQRLSSTVVTMTSSGLPGTATNIAETTSGQLTLAGLSTAVVGAITDATTSSSVSGAADIFYALAGKNVNRASGSDIAKLRRTSSEKTMSYLMNVNPTTKINSKNIDNFDKDSLI